jgi:hypothetical protein
VVATDETRPRGTFRESSGTPVPWTDAVDTWSHAARTVLEDVARNYGTWITYGELAERVQADTGIRTTKMIHYWIGQVLGRVARRQPPEEPTLTSLVVQANGTIGSGFLEIVRERNVEEPIDIELFAARERLACHHYFGATLPPDGGQPVYTHEVARRRARQRTRRRATPEAAFCPRCHVQLPATGVCSTCR